MRQITRDEIKSFLDSGAPVTLVEALPEKYWKDGHLPGAIQLDYTEVEARAKTALPDKDAKIIVYCANTACQNSSKAAGTLDELGYTDVYEYADGKQDWIEAGFPLEKATVN